jgi:hypothetical protein
MFDDLEDLLLERRDATIVLAGIERQRLNDLQKQLDVGRRARGSELGVNVADRTHQLEQRLLRHLYPTHTRSRA